MQLKTIRKILLSVAALCCISAAVCAAPALPSADSTIRGIEMNRPQRSSTALIMDGAGKSTLHKSIRERIRVASFVFSGQGEMPTEILEEALETFIDRDLTILDLHEAAAKAAAVCRAHGYPAVTAYLPVQDVGEGVIKIHIVIAKTETIHVSDRSSLIPGRAGDFAAMKQGEILTNEQVEETAQALGALRGVNASVLLMPGQTDDAVRVEMRIQDGNQASAALFSDNGGTEAAGKYRYGIIGTIHNGDHMGGTFQLSGLRSSGDVKNYAGRYETPFGNRGGKIGVLYARSDYSLSDRLAALGGAGLADTMSVYGNVPLRQSSKRSVALHYGFDHKMLTDRVDALSYEAKQSVNILHLGLAGKHAAAHSETSAAFVYYNGRLGMDNAQARTADAYANAAGRFHKGTLDVRHLERLTDRLDLTLTFHGQAASKNLAFAEKIYLGGINGVRAYAQGEASGDSGWQSSLEFRYRTSHRHLSLLAFVDTGSVQLVKSERTRRSLSGWGVGVQYELPDDLYLRTDYAWKINAQEDVSENRNKNGRVWFQICKMF